jgi:hypothetical protein
LLLLLLQPQDPYEALQLALDPTNIHPIDVALVNGEVFANLATAGVSQLSQSQLALPIKLHKPCAT